MEDARMELVEGILKKEMPKVHPLYKERKKYTFKVVDIEESDKKGYDYMGAFVITKKRDKYGHLYHHWMYIRVSETNIQCWVQPNSDVVALFTTFWGNTSIGEYHGDIDFESIGDPKKEATTILTFGIK